MRSSERRLALGGPAGGSKNHTGKGEARVRAPKGGVEERARGGGDSRRAGAALPARQVASPADGPHRGSEAHRSCSRAQGRSHLKSNHSNWDDASHEHPVYDPKDMLKGVKVDPGGCLHC